MSMTPSVEQFLAETSTEDDEMPEPFTGDPLVSIAVSLERLTDVLVRRDAQEEAEDQAQQLTEQLDHEYAELRQEHAAAQALLDEVLAICKPSTSKLANTIRAALVPEGETQPSADETETLPPVVEQPETGAVQCPACLLLFVDNDFLDRHECKAKPAKEAPVEEWRAYAQKLGHEYPFLDTANRSQIRTMLGISHTEA